jgi:hypothetical protein
VADGTPYRCATSASAGLPVGFIIESMTVIRAFSAADVQSPLLVPDDLGDDFKRTRKVYRTLSV